MSHFYITRYYMEQTHQILVLLSLTGAIMCWLPNSLLRLSQNGLFIARSISLLILYFIILHIIGAPFPRYSIPLRPIIYGMSLFPILSGVRIGQALLRSRKRQLATEKRSKYFLISYRCKYAMSGHTENTAVMSRQAAPLAAIMPIDHFDNIIVLIPAYNPGPEIVELVQALKENGCYRFVIVNDGSDHRCNNLFEQLNKIDGVDIRIHKSNQGKGAALKTGLRFIQTMAKGTGVITVDADGQHLPLDVVRLAIQARHHGNDVILGTRHFSENVPLRSRFGNRLTAFLLNAAYGISLEDTQTGLRYLPPDLLQVIVKLSSDGYEYELECLLAARDSGFTLMQLPIETVYIEGNASSHFRPISIHTESIKPFSASVAHPFFVSDWISACFQSLSMRQGM